MTGGEIIPVASAAAKVAKQALGEEESTKQQLARIAEDTEPMRRAAENYARRVEIKQAVLLKLYQPLAKWSGASREYFETDFARDMSSRIEDIPQEDLVSPPPSIAVPAMQGLGYSLGEPDLKEMYLNLLATATDGRRADEAHPSFAEVIKQLSALEARHLNSVLEAGGIPIAIVKRLHAESGGYNTLRRHFIDVRNLASGEPTDNTHFAVWVDNWVRLGLVDADYQHFLTAPTQYDWLDSRPEVVELNAERPDAPVEFDRGILSPTDFGKRFARAVGAVKSS